MEFNIKQGASQPVLVMKVTNDSNHSYEKFHTALENSTITFSMMDVESGKYRITKKRGGLIQNTSPVLREEEYFIYYKFTEKDTNHPGKYKGEFKIEFYDTVPTIMTGTFIAPLGEDLIINVVNSIFTEENLNNK